MTTYRRRWTPERVLSYALRLLGAVAALTIIWTTLAVARAGGL